MLFLKPIFSLRNHFISHGIFLPKVLLKAFLKIQVSVSNAICLKTIKSKKSLIRHPNLKDRNNGITIPKMLPKSVGHDFIHLSKSPWKISVVKQK